MTEPRLIGCSRVSTDRQDTEIQRDALLQAGCWPVVDETASGANRKRKGLAQALAMLRPGDTLAVWKLDRLGRSMLDLLTLLEELQRRGIRFLSLTEQFDTATPTGKLHLQIMGAFAEFEREMIRARTMPGLEAARAKGHFGGRRRSLYGAKLARAQKMYDDRPINPATGQPYTVMELAALFKVSANTLLRYVKRGGVPNGKVRSAKFLAEHPDIDAWLLKTDDPMRGTNPAKRRLRPTPKVLTRDQAEAEGLLR